MLNIPVRAAGLTLTYGCAGHPPPLLADGDTVTYLDGGRSAALGFGEPHGQAPLTVRPGARLVPYTDGLIERRAEPIDAGFDRLVQAARQNRDRDIAAWGQSLLTALTQGEILADDVALACIEVRGLR